MKYLPCVLLLLLVSCNSDKSSTHLEPPVFYQAGSQAMKWKKIELPVVDPVTKTSIMKIVGYLKVMEYRINQRDSVEYFDVVNSEFDFMGRISSQGRVSKFRINPYTREAEQLTMGDHILEAGVAKVLNILGEDRYLMVITDLKISDTSMYLDHMRKKRAETIATQQKAMAKEKAADEKSEEEENEEDE